MTQAVPSRAADAEHRGVDAHHLRLAIGKDNLDDGRHPYVQACDRNAQNQSSDKESGHPLRTSDKRPENDACKRQYRKRPAPQPRDERQHRQAAQPKAMVGMPASTPKASQDMPKTSRTTGAIGPTALAGAAHDERCENDHEEDLISTVHREQS